jgi:hypothetical protein
VETSGVASEPGVMSTSRVAQAMDIDTDSEQSNQIQMESEDKTPDMNQRGNIGPHESSELQQLASVPVWCVRKLPYTMGTCDRPFQVHVHREHFHLELKNGPAEHTMLIGSCINLTFSRYRHLIRKPYVSYFSYDYPVFNKITL